MQFSTVRKDRGKLRLRSCTVTTSTELQGQKGTNGGYWKCYVAANDHEMMKACKGRPHDKWKSREKLKR